MQCKYEMYGKVFRIILSNKVFQVANLLFHGQTFLLNCSLIIYVNCRLSIFRQIYLRIGAKEIEVIKEKSVKRVTHLNNCMIDQHFSHVKNRFQRRALDIPYRLDF